MMDEGGEGGLGVDIGIVEWVANPFTDEHEARLFLIENREKTDEVLHIVADGFIIFTRKED